MIGGDYFTKNIDLLQADGRLVYINAMGGKNVQIDILKMMQKRLTITGSTLRAREISFKASLTAEVYEKVWPILEQGLFKVPIFASFQFLKQQMHTDSWNRRHISEKLCWSNRFTKKGCDYQSQPFKLNSI
jgi:NADPH:quinone reductase-like Zn-dependent oxidoreductase